MGVRLLLRNSRRRSSFRALSIYPDCADSAVLTTSPRQPRQSFDGGDLVEIEGPRTEQTRPLPAPEIADIRADLLDDPDALVADDRARSHAGYRAADEMKVCPADRSGRDPDKRIDGLGKLRLEPDVAHVVENDCSRADLPERWRLAVAPSPIDSTQESVHGEMSRLTCANVGLIEAIAVGACSAAPGAPDPRR